MFNLIKELCKCQGVSGREDNIASLIEKKISPYFDSVNRDAMGNVIAFKKGSWRMAKKVMFAAHTDEIGFIVTYIEDNGYIRFAPVGGINFVSCAFSDVVFENGKCGVLVPEAGTKPEEIKFDKCYVDIGAKNKKEAQRLVKVGDTFAVAGKVKKLAGSKISGRPLDDRVGCAVLIDAASKIKNNRHDLYFVFTVQEEVGLRGSKTASFGIMPDYGIAVDVCPVGDVPGAKPMAVSLGGGAAVKIKDDSVLCDRELVEKIENLAEKNSIRYQREILVSGGTDTASMQLTGNGAKATCISIPARYIHSTVETVDMNDIKCASALVAAIAESEI